MSDSERARRAEAHRLMWDHGMCTASAKDPQPQHGTLCTDLVALLAERDLERDALREALEEISLAGTMGHVSTWDCAALARRALAKGTPTRSLDGDVATERTTK